MTYRPGTPTGMLGRREHKKHLTRQELLAAGRRLFAEKGLYQSSIEDLSKQAGLAKGTLYGYFANKEDLIGAVVTNGFNELLGRVHRAVQDASNRPEAIERIVDAHLEFFHENPDLMRIFHQVRGMLKFDHRDLKPLRGALDRYLAGIAQVLALHGRGRGVRGPTDREVATVLFGAISGVASVYASIERVVPHRANAPRLRRALVGTLISYERPDSGTPRPRRAVPAASS